ncbi:MAG: hypothetical protein KA282_01765 [Clostridia bacterium]|nr:hypothetical protein [Clostridia bacterium]
MIELSSKSLVYGRIQNAEPNATFIATDFLDIADYNTVRKALERLEDEGKIRRVIRGIYDYPFYSDLLKEYAEPSPHHVAMALARNYKWNIAPSGNTALNQLGLSTQVTSRYQYISDGPYRKYQLDNIEIEFKHRNNKEISGLSYKSAMVIQALKTLGSKHIDDKIIGKLQRSLTDLEKKALLKEAEQTTSWIYSTIKLICGGQNRCTTL